MDEQVAAILQDLRFGGPVLGAERDGSIDGRRWLT